LVVLQRYGASAADARSSDTAPRSPTPAPAAPIPADRLWPTATRLAPHRMRRVVACLIATAGEQFDGAVRVAW